MGLRRIRTAIAAGAQAGVASLLVVVKILAVTAAVAAWLVLVPIVEIGRTMLLSPGADAA